MSSSQPIKTIFVSLSPSNKLTKRDAEEISKRKGVVVLSFIKALETFLPSSSSATASSQKNQTSTNVIFGELLARRIEDGDDDEAGYYTREFVDSLEQLLRAIAPKTVTAIDPPFETESIEAVVFYVELLLVLKQTQVFKKEIWEAVPDKTRFLLDLCSTRLHVLQDIPKFRAIVSAKGITHPPEPCDPQKDVIDIPFCAQDTFFKFDKLGKQKLSSTNHKPTVAFVLVAGGLGERLGATQIKLSLPADSLTNTSFLHMFLKHLQAMTSQQSPAVLPPLCIMTSDDTHQGTIDMLALLGVEFTTEDIGYTEKDVHKVMLVKQKPVPCFLDANGTLAFKSSPAGELLLKPHGHGDVHYLVHKSCVQAWSTSGVEYVAFFQDTNPSCFRIIPGLIGICDSQNLDGAIACVPRVPGSATGCIARNTQTNTIENFEYNIMNTYLASNPGLDSQFVLGNTNQFVVRLKPYLAIDPSMPEFCNPKYQPNSTTQFSSPARLECLMQDVLRSFHRERVKACLFQDFPGNQTKTHVLYAPAKNSVPVAQRAWDSNTSDGSPASSEAAVYAGNCALLQSIGCHVALDTKFVVKFGKSMQISPLYPSVVFDPLVLPFWSDVKDLMFPSPEKVHIGAKSSVEFRGPGKIICHKLVVNGSLLIWAKNKDTVLELMDVQVENSGRRVEVVDGDARLRVAHGENLKVIESDILGKIPITLAL